MAAVLLGTFVGAIVEFIVRRLQGNRLDKLQSFLFFCLQILLILLFLILGMCMKKEDFDDLIWSTHFGFFFNISFFLVQISLYNNVERILT
jgi:hypothetical protein